MIFLKKSSGVSWCSVMWSIIFPSEGLFGVVRTLSGVHSHCTARYFHYPRGAMCCAFLADRKSLLSPRHSEDNSSSKWANSVRKLDYWSQLRTRKPAKITACGPCFMLILQDHYPSVFLTSFFFQLAHCWRMTVFILSPLQIYFSGKKRVTVQELFGYLNCWKHNWLKNVLFVNAECFLNVNNKKNIFIFLKDDRREKNKERIVTFIFFFNLHTV